MQAVVDHRDGEARCLAAARLSTPKDVTTSQGYGDALTLDGRRCLILVLLDVFNDVLMQVLRGSAQVARECAFVALQPLIAKASLRALQVNTVLNSPSRERIQ